VLDNEGLRCVCDVEEFSREIEDETDEETNNGLGKPCDRDDAERDIGGGLRSAASAVIVSGDWCNTCSSGSSESSSRRTVFVSRSSSELVKASASGARLPWGSP
jgi:hypothetical protein